MDQPQPVFAVGKSGTGLDLLGSFLDLAAGFLDSTLVLPVFFPAPIFLPFGEAGSSVFFRKHVVAKEDRVKEHEHRYAYVILGIQ